MSWYASTGPPVRPMPTPPCEKCGDALCICTKSRTDVHSENVRMLLGEIRDLLPYLEPFIELDHRIAHVHKQLTRILEMAGTP